MAIPDSLFIIYILCAVLVWYIAPYSARRILLLISSFGLFCAFTGYLPLIPIALTACCYIAGICIDERLLGAKSVWKWVGTVICLLPSALLLIPGASGTSAKLMCVGVGFYSLTGIGYLLDVGRGEIKAERGLLDFGLYMCFFPKLFLGPVTDSFTGFELLRTPIEYNQERTLNGAARFALGMLKLKVAWPFVDSIVGLWINNLSASRTQAIAGFLLVFPALYLKLSGITDIFIGAGHAMGVELDDYFDAPMMSCTVWELMRRFCAPISAFFIRYIALPVLKRNNKRTWLKPFGASLALLCFFLWAKPNSGLLVSVCVLAIGLAADVLLLPRLTAKIIGCKPWIRWSYRQLRRIGTYFSASVMSLFYLSRSASNGLSMLSWVFKSSSPNLNTLNLIGEELFGLVPIMLLLIFAELYRYRTGRRFEEAADGAANKLILIACIVLPMFLLCIGGGVTAAEMV